MNKFYFSGRLGGDVEVRKTGNGDSYCRFSLAISDNKPVVQPDGTKKSGTFWMNFMAFGQRADYIGNYAHKGDTLIIEGHCSVEKRTKEDGSTFIQETKFVDSVELIRSKEPQQQQVQQQPYQQPQQYQKPAQPVAPQPTFDVDDADLPF